MRYPASEKIEIIRIVEQSSLSARHTLVQIGVPRATFYRWYDQYQTGFNEVAHSAKPAPQRRATSQNPPDSQVVDSLIQAAGWDWRPVCDGQALFR